MKPYGAREAKSRCQSERTWNAGRVILIITLVAGVTGWTLNYEMFFYAIFAASLLISRRFLHGSNPTISRSRIGRTLKIL
jgi:peptidoglycan/LPS O-acetylase OafA/YrhL